MHRQPGCNRRDAIKLAKKAAGSAGGPKPGRISFSVKLGVPDRHSDHLMILLKKYCVVFDRFRSSIVLLSRQ